MRTGIFLILICFVTRGMLLFGQEVSEVRELESGKEFWDLIKVADSLKKIDTTAAIIKLENAFYKTKNNYTRCKIMEELGPLYTSTDQYEKCLNMNEDLIKSGLSVYFQYWGETYPAYTKSLENNEKFRSLLIRNNELVKEQNINSEAEYYIQKPVNYIEGKRYPLLMVFPGGIGNIQDMQNFWQSEKLSNEFIVAFVHGKDFKCTYNYSYGSNAVYDMKNIYKKINEDYLIDTTKVILSGPSAGGMFSIDLAINNHLNARGLILAFPVKPENFNADNILNAGINGLAVSMICGENDWAIMSQKEMSVIFDKLGVKNKLIIFPETGHDFPKDFSKQIDNSLNFIFAD